MRLQKQKANQNNYKVTILNINTMAPEIYLDVFIVDHDYEKLQRQMREEIHPEVKQRELGEFI